MEAWVIGYPDGLDAVANEDAGIALYDPWSIAAISFDSKTPSRIGGIVTSISELVLTDTGNFVSGAYAGGWIKMRSGTKKGEVYKVVSNDVNALTCETGTTMDTDDVNIGDYYEVISGSTSFTFPAQRNPIRKDMKLMTKGVVDRFPYYEGGIDIPLGREADDIVVMAFLTGEAQFKALMMLLNQKMDYSGYDGNFTSDEAAPLIIQMGTDDADSQYLVSFSDHKIVKDGGKGGNIDVMLHFRAINMPSYRGI